MKNIAVVLFQLGGPDSPEAVQPFLENLFNDPDIFKLPFQKKLAKFISTKRAPKVQGEYSLIGGKSPIKMWTEKQRALLEEELNNKGIFSDVYMAMRYWNPLTAEAVKSVTIKEYQKIVLLPLYPQFSISTTGSSFNEWKRHYKGEDEKLVYINNFYDHPLYIKALNQRIDETLAKFPEDVRDDVQLVFSAHGTPVSFVKKGDPYSQQIKLTVDAVMEARKNSHNHHLCFQSKVGPAKWLEPSTDKMIQDLSKKGLKNLLIIPISFVSDHVETLFELNIEYRHVADSAGIDNYIVMQGLNDSKLFIDALLDITIKNI